MARWVGNYMPQKPILDALELVGLRLPMQVVSNACSSGTNSIGHAFNLIRDGLNSCVICGGYDPLSELVFVGFDSLQAYWKKSGLLICTVPDWCWGKAPQWRFNSRIGRVSSQKKGDGLRRNFRLWSLDRYLPSNSAKPFRRRSAAFDGTCASIRRIGFDRLYQCSRNSHAI